MASKKNHILFFFLLTAVLGLLSACVRTAQEDPVATTDPAVATTDPNVPTVDPAVPTVDSSVPLTNTEVITPAVTTEVIVEPVESPTAEGESPRPEEATATPEGAVVEQPVEPTPAAVVEQPTTVPTTTEQPVTEAPATTVPSDGTLGQQIHVVQVGESLYQIGLKYGVSWVALAEYNQLTNANALLVGQELKIPLATTMPVPPVTPTPVPVASDETTYTVAVGDNLFRIGLAFGVSWIQIAEANGLVNPNQIYVGQVLKIPTNQPGPTPQFTHVVQEGETVFTIALRYGVVWTTIAEANTLTSPYVIYPQQTLVIPGQ